MATSGNKLTDMTAPWDSFWIAPGKLNREPKFDVYAAAYLPWNRFGQDIDWGGFENVLRRIWNAGAIPVVNADTGFSFHPSVEPRKGEILRWIQSHFPNKPYVAAIKPPASKVQVFDDAAVVAYSADIQEALDCGATEFMVMISPGLVTLQQQELIDAYAKFVLPEGRGILHELTSEFVPFGRQFTPFEFFGIMTLPGFGASKTSDLFSDCMNPRMGLKASSVMKGARVLSGVDYKVEEAFRICDGVLMGAATIWPELYVLAAKLYNIGLNDQRLMWRFETLVRNLQSVAAHQFRPYTGFSDAFDVGGYRHLTAMYLMVQGTIPCSDQPANTQAQHQRPDSELDCVKSMCRFMRKTLEKIGEDPDLVRIV